MFTLIRDGSKLIRLEFALIAFLFFVEQPLLDCPIELENDVIKD